MPEQTTPNVPVNAIRKVVWVAMMATVGMHGLMAFFLVQGGSVFSAPSWIFMVIAMGLAAGAWMIGRGPFEKNTRTEAYSSVALHPRLLVAWALDEAVGVVGLVATLASGTIATYVTYGVVAIILLVLHKPQEETR